ncbi:MurR/RpiR family transcriptional regulator [Fundicoccus culcitae]|uniref:SIS domain-containing protein n=1 Tax=Fundicoccus culcitae TaxID=2969821 RepID=A0ABY5P838_9LACT|nr:SIS domain-containing protein [Fundicoccus culcitae]UUX34912.1 SIS domain-containing protein [Fundicoccus culcitae]
MIMDKLNDITNSYQKDSTTYLLSQFFQEHIHEIPYLTIGEIAQRTHISKSQISKYVRHLDYKDYIDFKDACMNYITSLERRQNPFERHDSFEVNAEIFNKEFFNQINYSMTHIDNKNINRLIQQINQAKTVYLYGQGDARFLCYQIQTELQILNKHAIVSDSDFNLNYNIAPDDLFILLSINGNTFKYNHNIVRRLDAVTAQRWLVTSKDRLNFNGNQLIFPVEDNRYSEYLFKYMIDLLLLNIKRVQD